MRKKNYLLVVCIALAAGVFPQGNVSADAGPKPTMDFEFVQDVPGERLTVVSGILYSCDKADCSDAQPVIEKGIHGAWGFLCNNQECSAFYDGTYFQLEVTFSDGQIRRSNTFGKSYFDAKYRVIIEPNSLIVKELEGSDPWEEVRNFLTRVFLFVLVLLSAPLLIAVPILIIRNRRGLSNLWLRSCIVVFYMAVFALWGLIQNSRAFLITLFVELCITTIFLLIKKIKGISVLFAVSAANSFTQPVFFFLVSQSSNIVIATIVGELLVWFSEAVFIFFMQEKHISFKQILLLTFLMNSASLGIGLLLPT